MSAFTDFSTDAFDEVLDLLGENVTHKGTVYKGVINSLRIGSKPQDGGLLEEADTIIVVRKSDFATAPLVSYDQSVNGDGGDGRMLVSVIEMDIHCQTLEV